MSEHDYYTNIERPQTAKKLSILRKYFHVWLTIWSSANSQKWAGKRWYVIDLFAGTGAAHAADGAEISGSPVVFLEEIETCAERLRNAGIRITLVLVERDGPSFDQLNGRVSKFLREHAVITSVLDVELHNRDCNDWVDEFTAATTVRPTTPAFIFVDPFGLAIRRSTLDRLTSLPWAPDILFNYMLDGIKRVYGASVGSSNRAESNAATLAAYFGEGTSVEAQADIENPEVYARAAFCSRGLRVVAFFMKWPNKEATQYILLFACRKPTIVNIMRGIYAKEMVDLYGQPSLFGVEEHLASIEVIEP